MLDGAAAVYAFSLNAIILILAFYTLVELEIGSLCFTHKKFPLLNAVCYKQFSILI